MNCLIVDDEPLALDVIENYIRKIPGLNIAAKVTSPLDALTILRSQPIDLMFLDIHMSEISGIDFLKSLNHAPLVIFTTAYDQYALESYELDVVDYLLKPIPFERFLKAINKAREVGAFLRTKGNSGENREFIFVRSDYQMVKINFSNILYIEGLKDYVKIFTGPKPVFSHQNLKSIEAKLPDSQFLRVHKSFIIPVNKIEAVQKNSLRVAGTEIPIGDTYRDQVQRMIGNMS